MQKNGWQELLEKHPTFNGFVQSTYITVFTDWFTTLGAKTAHFVLIVTIIYMGAELFPGVSLPPSLNLTMFVLQFIALDLGGIGLKTAAKQAAREGNAEGAAEGKKLGGFLINILFATLVVAILKQIVSGMSFSSDVEKIKVMVEMFVEGVLLILRAWCAVRYGDVIHGLKHEGNYLVETLRETIGNLQQQLGDHQQQLGNLQQQVGNHENEMVTIKGNHEKEKVTMQGNHESEMVTIKGDLENIIGNLKNDVVTIKGNLDVVIDERDDLQRQISRMTASVQGLSTDTTRLQQDKDALELSLRETIKRMEREKQTMDGTIFRLQGDLQREKEKVTQVTSEVAYETNKVTPIRLPKPSQVTSREVTSQVTNEGDEVTNGGNARDRIKSAMQEAAANNRKIAYREIAEVAGTTEAYVKKFGATIKKELGISDRGTDEMELVAVGE